MNVKYFLTILMTLLWAMSARAQFFHWKVDQLPETGYAFDYATIKGGTIPEYLLLETEDGPSGSYKLAGISYPATSYSTGNAYTDIGERTGTFLVELWKRSETEDKPVAFANIDFDSIRDHLYVGISTIGSGDPFVVGSFTVTPEPTSGMLLLFGLSVLALRRRRARSGVALLFVALLAVSAFAQPNDVVVTFSTPGTDRYADGTPVLDGECYALVYTPAGATFAGIRADGAEVDPATGRIVLCVPVAKDGRCPELAFELDAGYAAENFPNGSWSVYLLDTRRWGEGVAPSGTENGRPKVVNGYGLVAGGRTAVAGAGAPTGLSAASGAAADLVSAVPEGTPKPRITGIRIVDGFVYLTVQDTVPYLTYTTTEIAPDGSVAEGEKTGISLPTAVQGEAGREITIVRPATGASGMFRVGRK